MTEQSKVTPVEAQAVPDQPVAPDEFRGDTEHLVNCILALLNLDAAGAVQPRVCGHARILLASAAARLRPTPAAADQPSDELIECEECEGTGCDADLPNMTCPVCFGRGTLVAASPAAAAGVPTLTDERITELGHRHAWRYKKSSDPHHSDTYTFNGCCLHNFAHALLSRQGCELATDATKQQMFNGLTQEETDATASVMGLVHLAATPIDQDFRRRPASSEAAPSADPRMAFCPACFEEVTSEQADEQTRDARRYRWMRKSDTDLAPIFRNDIDEATMLTGEMLDRAIDAAMKEQA